MGIGVAWGAGDQIEGTPFERPCLARIRADT